MGHLLKKEENEFDYSIELELQLLREHLAAELLSINQYQEHVESLTDDDILNVLENIRDAKKEHVARLLKLICKLDTIQAEILGRSKF